MRIVGAGRLVVPAIVLAASAACGPAADVGPVAGAHTAVASYEAPDGAPGFCTQLASASELGRLPVSIGLLVAGSDVEARTQISQVMRELRAVLSDVREEGGHDALETALDDLVRALGAVVEGPITDPVRGAVTAGLERVGAQTQPECGFPT